MKKFYLSLFFVSVLILNVVAQTIPNNSFENWSTYPGTTIEDPNFWLTSNLENEVAAEIIEANEQAALDMLFTGAVASSSVPPSAVKATGHNGSSALKVQNVIITTTETYLGSSHYSYSTPLPGYASVYSVTADGDTAMGIPVTGSPIALTGFYKFNQGSTTASLDTGIVYIYLNKWNTNTMESDSIGYGEIIIKANVTTFTAFTVNIVNTSGLVPDTANIVVASSLDQASTNTYLIVDDLAFTSATGITPVFSNTSGIALYPNPAKDQVTIKNLPVNAVEIQVMDYMGRRVTNVSALGNEVNFNTSTFTSGLYFYNVLDNTGAMLYTSRFTVAN